MPFVRLHASVGQHTRSTDTTIQGTYAQPFAAGSVQRALATVWVFLSPGLFPALLHSVSEQHKQKYHRQFLELVA